MNRLLRLLSLLLAFTCAMRMWQYYAGVRLVIFDLLLAAFVAVYGVRLLLRGRLAVPPAGLRLLLVLLWLVFFVSLASYFQIDFTLAPLTTTQFAKGIFDLLLHAGGLTALVLYWWEEPADQGVGDILRAYLLGTAASGLYCFIEVALASRGHDLGKLVFGSISTYPPDFDWSAPFYFEWDNFFRAVGFSGVNSQATYTASAVPLLLFAAPFRRRAVNLLLAAACLLGTALTLSRNGFFTLCIALLICVVLQPQLARRLFRWFLLALVPVALICTLSSDTAIRLLGTRTYSSAAQFGSGRWEIYEAVWPTIAAHPLGHGLNQFSVVIEQTRQIDISPIEVLYFKKTEAELRRAYANVHNNWLNWLFEGGWPLLLAYCAYYLAILHLCWRARNPLGVASLAIGFALLVSGFFNMTLDLFSTELLFILLAVCSVRTRVDCPPEAPPSASTPC